LAARTSPKNFKYPLLLIHRPKKDEFYTPAKPIVPLHKKFQKIQKFIALVGACPKTEKAKIWPLRTLGVNLIRLSL
jgi:hypothetical protein